MAAPLDQRLAVVHVATELEAPADAVFGAVTTPAALLAVTRGLIGFPVVRGRVEPWQEGETVAGVLLLFGLVPFSRHRITVVELDRQARRLRSDEAGGAIRHWRHEIVVTPIGDRRCRYEDRIEIEAGALTPLVRAFAEVFYRVRQHRWRRLAPVLAAVSG